MNFKSYLKVLFSKVFILRGFFLSLMGNRKIFSVLSFYKLIDSCRCCNPSIYLAANKFRWQHKNIHQLFSKNESILKIVLHNQTRLFMVDKSFLLSFYLASPMGCFFVQKSWKLRCGKLESLNLIRPAVIYDLLKLSDMEIGLIIVYLFWWKKVRQNILRNSYHHYEI